MENEKCGCCNEEMEEINNIKLSEDVLENDETIVLETEDGQESCKILGVFSIEEKEQEYIALLSENDVDVYLYKYKEFENKEFEIESIDSDDEFEIVSEVFNTLFSEDE